MGTIVYSNSKEGTLNMNDHRSETAGLGEVLKGLGFDVNKESFSKVCASGNMSMYKSPEASLVHVGLEQRETGGSSPKNFMSNLFVVNGENNQSIESVASRLQEFYRELGYQATQVNRDYK